MRVGTDGLPGLSQTFVKVVNYQHMMPTRYTLDVDLKGVVANDAAENSTKRLEARKVRFLSHLCHFPAVYCIIHRS